MKAFDESGAMRVAATLGRGLRAAVALGVVVVWAGCAGGSGGGSGAGAGAITWRSLGPGAGSDLLSAAFAPGSTSTFFVGGDIEGLYRTGNALAASTSSVAWTYLYRGASTTPAFATDGWLSQGWTNNLHVAFVAVSPADRNVLVAGHDEVYKSTDGGDTWREMYTRRTATNTFAGTGLELMVTLDVAVDPNDASRWWIGYDDMGLWRTDDGGGSFVRLDPKQDVDPSSRLATSTVTDAVRSIAVDPTDSDTVYVGRSGGTQDGETNWDLGYVYKSVDSGVSWEQLGAGLLEGGRPQLLLLPDGSSTSTGTRTLLCAIYGRGLFRSTDSGGSWQSVSSSFVGAANHHRHVWSLAAGPAAAPNTTVYAGITDGESVDLGQADPGAIYRSANAGATWIRLPTSTTPTAHVLSLAVGSDGTVYAATTAQLSSLTLGTGLQQGGLYRSRDDGQTWQRVLAAPLVTGVSVDPQNPARVVALSSSGWSYLAGLEPGAFLSEDGGETWTRYNDGFSQTHTTFCRFHPLTPGRIFAGTDGGGLFLGTLQVP